MSRQTRTTKRATKSAPVIDNPPIEESIDCCTDGADDTTENAFNEIADDSTKYKGQGVQEANEIPNQINIIDEINTALKKYEKIPAVGRNIFVGFFDIYDDYNKEYVNEEKGNSYSCPFYIISVGIIRNINGKNVENYAKIGTLIKNNANYDKIKKLSIRQFIKVDSKLYKDLMENNQDQKQLYKFYVNKFLTNKNNSYGTYSVNLNYCRYEKLENNNIIDELDYNLPFYANMYLAYVSGNPNNNFTEDIVNFVSDIKII